MKMSEGPDVGETQTELCRSQSTRCLPKKKIRVRHRGVEHVLLQRGRTGKGSRAACHGECVSRGLKSGKTIGSNEVGGVGEESSVMKPGRVHKCGAVCCVWNQCGGVRPKIAARDRDRFRESVGGVPETSEARGTE